MLDYKDILTKRYVLRLSLREIAEQTGRCKAEGKKAYQYRQFCELFGKWCDENYETAHFTAVIAQTMEVDFAGKTFDLINRLTGEITPIVVFVAVLPYFKYIYAEGMESTKEMQWIEVNNNALKAFGGVHAVCCM